jgi:hypothetical protein
LNNTALCMSENQWQQVSSNIESVVTLWFKGGKLYMCVLGSSNGSKGNDNAIPVIKRPSELGVKLTLKSCFPRLYCNVLPLTAG